MAARLEGLSAPGEGAARPADRPPAAQAPATLALPGKPSIAVLPFDNMSGDPEQEHFADGVVEALTAALSRIRPFFIIARNSAFAYKGRALNAREIGRELGVAYVLEGSVQRRRGAGAHYRAADRDRGRRTFMGGKIRRRARLSWTNGIQSLIDAMATKPGQDSLVLS